MTNIRWYVREKNAFREPERMQGLYIDESIESVREAAEWVRSSEGWEVPFLTAEGLLIRWPKEDGEARYHHWFPTGTHLHWNGLEFDSWGSYVPEGESHE